MCPTEPANGWLDPDQQRHWRAALRGTALLMDQLERDLHEASGLSLSEYEIMVRLSEVPQRRMRMSVLAEDLVHSRSRLTHTVSRMESKGLVSRCRVDGDRRGVQCMLTEAGYEALQQVAPDHVDSVRAWLVDALTPAELAGVGESFGRVAERIEGAQGRPPSTPLVARVEGQGTTPS